MKKKKITRKEFIKKTGKCAGGIICGPMILSIFQSCEKPDPISSVTDETMYIAQCDFHGAQFDQDGNPIRQPQALWDGNEIGPLKKYSTVINDTSFMVSNGLLDENGGAIEITIPFEDHPSLENINGVSAADNIPFDNFGILLYRKSQTEIIALSRECTHFYGGSAGEFTSN